jgi:hypothetical protein
MKIFLSVCLSLILTTSSLSQNYWWEQKLSGGGRGNPITLDPLNNNIVYYGSSTAVFKSTDRGETFVQYGSSIPQASAVKCLHINPNRPNEMVVAVYKSGGGYKMVKTTDNGVTWFTTADNLSFSFFGVPSTQDPTHPDSIYLMNGNNFDRSTDFGSTWTTLTSSVGTFSAPCDIEVFPDTSIILVGDNGTGIFRSTNYGLTWTHPYSTSGEIPTIAVDFNKPGTAWATKYAGGGGIIRSTDYGQTWVIVAYSGTSTWGVHINPNNSDYVAVGTWSGSNVFITRNWGVNWQQTSLPASNYAVAIIDSMNVFAAQSGGFYKLNSDYFIPVELSSFTASVVNNKIVLNWSTASETNNMGFDIEQSFDNQSYNKIGFMPGFGTTTDRQSYSYIVEGQFAEKSFYRLRQVDYDGTFEYSNVVEVDAITPDGFNLSQNYPNPFNPSTKITYTLPGDYLVTLKVFDMIGREITTLVNENQPAGYYEIDFSADELSSGVYIYRFNAVNTKGEVENFSGIKKMTLIK